MRRFHLNALLALSALFLFASAFLAQEHEYVEAARHLAEALKLNPDDPAAQACLEGVRQALDGRSSISD